MRSFLIALCTVAVMLALAPQESQAGPIRNLLKKLRPRASCAQCADVQRNLPPVEPLTDEEAYAIAEVMPEPARTRWLNSGKDEEYTDGPTSLTVEQFEQLQRELREGKKITPIPDPESKRLESLITPDDVNSSLDGMIHVFEYLVEQQKTDPEGVNRYLESRGFPAVDRKPLMARPVGLFGRRLFGGRRAVGSCANGQCGKVEKSQVAGPSRCYVDSKGNKVCPVK